MNVEKARLDKIYANNEIQSMVQAFGITISKNEEEYILSNFHLENIDVKADKVDWDQSAIRGLKIKKVKAEYNE